jgi:hypothetical protein
MTYFRQEECKDCDEGKIYRVIHRFCEQWSDYEEAAHDCEECGGSGIIEIEEEDNE